jgi:peptidoglycan/LPS O-acetylase OafA/YrhL
MLNRTAIALRNFGFGSQRLIPSLDGLRAVSIAFVLLAHLNGTRNFPKALAPLGELGEFGVRVFFVISGYLITLILQSELRKHGRISLPRFYFRRTLRLFPAAYSLILVVALLSTAGLLSLRRGDLAFGLSYAMNYHIVRAWPLGHLWSLAVEEQFYLLWPLTLQLLQPSRARRLLFALLLVTPLLRLVAPFVVPVLSFVVWADALATGCLLALIRDELGANRTYMRLLGSGWFFLVPIAAVAANYVPSAKLDELFLQTVMNLAIALSADWAMRNHDHGLGRFLNQPAVSFLGVLSYSLYLWQQLFLNRFSASPYCAFPLNVALAFILALASYLLIEAPFLRIRTAIERAHARRGARRAVPSQSLSETVEAN